MEETQNGISPSASGPAQNDFYPPPEMVGPKMSKIRVTALVVLGITCLLSALAQNSAQIQNLQLNVRVAPKKGPTTTNLQAQDFTVLDNHASQRLLSFRAVTASQEPVKVILVIDAVNIDFTKVAYARDQAVKFLRSNNGQLQNPTTIAILTDQGTQIEKSFTKDGNALSTSLNDKTVGLREIRRSSGIWGADERVTDSLRAVQEFMTYASSLSGRKVLVWISPGWPLLSNPSIQLSSKQQSQIFKDVIAFSNELQRSNVTLYSVNPLGVNESLYREDYYQSFLNGISKASQTDLADLSLQVLAIQSGGLALNGSNDVAGGLATCAADLDSWYELTVPIQRGDEVNEYHHIEVKVDRSDLVGRTRDGYYAQP